MAAKSLSFSFHYLLQSTAGWYYPHAAEEHTRNLREESDMSQDITRPKMRLQLWFLRGPTRKEPFHREHTCDFTIHLRWPSQLLFPAGYQVLTLPGLPGSSAPCSLGVISRGLLGTTKDTSSTQEIPGVLGVLGQEPGTKSKWEFPVIPHWEATERASMLL